MKCQVTFDGRLENCVIVSEDPPGYGFGEAALKMAPLFKMKPKTQDGAPVGGATVIIPVRFQLPTAPSNGPVPAANPSATTPPPAQMDSLKAKAVTGDGVYWDASPSAAQTLGAYPPKALQSGVDGTAKMMCRITAEGELADCTLAEEKPVGWGFGDAALSLAGYFKIHPTTRKGQPVTDSTIIIPLKFGAPAAR